MNKTLKVIRGKQSQKDFAEEMGIKTSQYNRIEKGKSLPTMKLLKTISEKRNLQLSYIFLLSEYQTGVYIDNKASWVVPQVLSLLKLLNKDTGGEDDYLSENCKENANR